jgi:glycosyltransferase involved in cell wall biosynthesis
VSVLQIGKYYYPYMGGIENHLYLLCNELKNRVALEVVVCNDERQTVNEVVEGVRVTRCGQVTNVASTSLSPQMPLVLSRRRYRIIHFHFPNPMGVMAYLTSTKPGPHKVVVTYHSDIVRQENLQKIYAPFMHRVLNQAAVIICTSPNYLDSSATLARYRQKCQVIPYGIDISQFGLTPTIEAQATALRQQYRGPLLLAVGRLIYYKGFEYLITAMRNIDAELLLIGDGPLREELERLARECGVAERVHFLGEIHNPASHALLLCRRSICLTFGGPQ